jgi:hypothetical protein
MKISKVKTSIKVANIISRNDLSKNKIKMEWENIWSNVYYEKKPNKFDLDGFKNFFLENKEKIEIEKVKYIVNSSDSKRYYITEKDKENIKNADPKHSDLLTETFNRLQKKDIDNDPGLISPGNWKKIFNDIDIDIKQNGLITESELEEFLKKLFKNQLEPVKPTTGGKKLRKKSKKHSRKGLHKSRKNNRKSRK